jgi:NAD(P)-dependent dehydrogenase (short-subunit alcohol dehydrogenase family)
VVDLGLEGKVALVTASSRGLGRASALALSQEGPRWCCAPATRARWPRRPRPCPGRPWPCRPTSPTSNTARTGLWGWAKTAAADLFGDGITLNLACPGIHATDRARQTGLGGGPVGDPADFGKVVCFLCSEPARFVSGAALQVDGAATTGLL